MAKAQVQYTVHYLRLATFLLLTWLAKSGKAYVVLIIPLATSLYCNLTEIVATVI